MLKLIEAFFIPFLVLVCGCGDVSLRSVQGQQLESASAGEFVSTLKPPESTSSQVRVLFFIDQSYSMIHGKCPGDLDGANPVQSSVGCSHPDPGMDPEGHRFSVIEKWIRELQKQNPTAKIALYPFSGGMHERPRRYPYNVTPVRDGLEFYKFTGPDLALTRLQDLKAEQNFDLTKDTLIDEGHFTGAAPTYMGTTVPLPTLLFARDQIYKEMEQLQKQGLLSNTKFRFIYISDGMFNPTQNLIDQALSTAGGNCSPKCLQDPRIVTCDNGWASMNGKGWGSLTDAEKLAWPKECGMPAANGFINSCYCLNVGNDLIQSFGDPSLNKFERIVDTINQIKNLPKSFGEGNLRIDFVKVHPERLTTEDEALVKSIFDEVQKREGDSQVSAITDENPPFSISGSTASQLTYQLDSFYVVNLNAFVSDAGNLVADSDGDGISDEEELSQGTDPLNPRSLFPEDGLSWCLDSIEKKFSCKKTSCSRHLDSDNDGLNECEELTLQTDPFLKDNGADGVLHSLKAIRGFALGPDLRKLDSNADGVSDLDQFKMGLSPMTRAKEIPDAMKVKVRTQFRAYVKSTDSAGQSIQTAQYSVYIDQIPLIGTRATTVSSELYSSKTENSQTRISDNFIVGPTTHKKNENEILILGKVQAIQDPSKSYWIMNRKKILATGSNRSFQVDFSEFKQLPGK